MELGFRFMLPFALFSIDPCSSVLIRGQALFSQAAHISSLNLQ